MRRVDFKKTVKVLIVDDNLDHAAGVRELINSESDFEVISTASSANIALSLAKKYRPDVVLMDINMPDVDGITATAELRKINSAISVIALSGYDDGDLIYKAMKAGAKGYILKTMASAQLLYAIEDVANGKIYLPASLSARFFEQFHKTSKVEEEKVVDNEENLLSYLTLREEEVLDLLTKGHTYRNIANELCISETTVKTHVNNIFQKIQVNDRTQAVLYAINHGFAYRKKMKAVI